MTEIITSLLATGGWGLIVGWILPTAINSLLLILIVLPALQDVSPFHAAAAASVGVKALILLGMAVVGGLVLSAFQTPLYRLLEGYLWPPGFRRAGTAVQLRRKRLLEERLELARIAGRDEATLSERDQARKAELERLLSARRSKMIRLFSPEPVEPRRTQSWQVSVLAEHLRRYPVDDRQVLPSRLGNAIRRFEEYGYDRYRLDVVTMWYALTGAVRDQVRKQVDASRTSVDFFVCLIYGHIIVALAALAAFFVVTPLTISLLVTAVVVLVLSLLWYRLAISATDEWAAAVRGLVDLGRKPLAKSLGLALPPTLEQERDMWQKVSRLGRRPYGPGDSRLDHFRASYLAITPGTSFGDDEDDSSPSGNGASGDISVTTEPQPHS